MLPCRMAGSQCGVTGVRTGCKRSPVLATAVAEVCSVVDSFFQTKKSAFVVVDGAVGALLFDIAIDVVFEVVVDVVVGVVVTAVSFFVSVFAVVVDCQIVPS